MDCAMKLEGFYEMSTVHGKTSLMKATLVNSKLKDEKSVFKYFSGFQNIINKLTTIEIVVDDELQAFVLIKLFVRPLKNLVVTNSNVAS